MSALSYTKPFLKTEKSRRYQNFPPARSSNLFLQMDHYTHAILIRNILYLRLRLGCAKQFSYRNCGARMFSLVPANLVLISFIRSPREDYHNEVQEESTADSHQN